MIRKEEYIPDGDHLYRRIHPHHYDNNERRVTSAAFRGKGDYDASVNWEKYITPQEAIAKYPIHHLASLQAKVPRAVGQEVRHTPSFGSRSHSSIIGKKTLSVAKHLADNSALIIKR